MIHWDMVRVFFAALLVPLLPAPTSAALAAATLIALKSRGPDAAVAGGRFPLAAEHRRTPGLLLRQFTQSSQSLDRVAAAPLANDTVSQAYWLKVDLAIANAQTTTEAPGASTPTLLYSATHQRPDITAEDLTPGEIAAGKVVGGVSTSVSPSVAAARVVGHEALVSYDMALGARLMYGLSSKATSTPPPEQHEVSQQLVAHCPMIMFANSLYISAPRCGETMGQWQDPATSRTILRWSSPERGSVHFGVDSVVTGTGSAEYAEISQQVSLQGTYFNLMNCLRLTRYTIEEEVVKASHMGPGTSSIQEHDSSKVTQTFFYKYKIVAPNGTAVAETSLFRGNQNQLNVTMYDDEVSMGPTLATARRVGKWNNDEWRQCTSDTRAWQVDFLISERDFDSVATVMDLRVATAALITLMAFRAETVSADTGVPPDNSLKQLLKSVLYVLLAMMIVGIIIFICYYMGWVRRMRRCCFKLEAVCLPRMPIFKRAPAFNPTY